MVPRSTIANLALGSLFQQAFASPALIPRLDRKWVTDITVSVPSNSVPVVSFSPSSHPSHSSTGVIPHHPSSFDTSSTGNGGSSLSGDPTSSSPAIPITSSSKPPVPSGTSSSGVPHGGSSSSTPVIGSPGTSSGHSVTPSPSVSVTSGSTSASGSVPNPGLTSSSHPSIPSGSSSSSTPVIGSSSATSNGPGASSSVPVSLSGSNSASSSGSSGLIPTNSPPSPGSSTGHPSSSTGASSGSPEPSSPGVSSTPSISSATSSPASSKHPPGESSSALPQSTSSIASPTEASSVFPTTVQVATTTVAPAAATSEASDLSLLFFALHANRVNLDDPKKKHEYIDDVEKTKKEVHNFVDSLEVKPPTPPECSPNSLKKRGLVSGLSNLIGDIPKLASCASEVIDTLEEDVRKPEPPASEIEDLTDTLEEIGEYMDESDDDQKSSSNSLSTTSGSSTTSCTSSAEVLSCTETISLSTSFYSGATPSSTVSTITSTTCSTATACRASTTIQTTTVSTSTATGEHFCSPSSDDYFPGAKFRLAKRSGLLEERTLDLVSNYDGTLDYLEGIISDESTEEVMHRTTGKGSSAKTVQFLDRPRRIWVQGLIGCTSVSIISEAGAWVSHFWEEPGFNKADQARFNDDVLDAIRNGDNNVNMPAAYPLGQDGNYLNPSNNVQIFIMAPADTANNQPLYPDRLGQVENVLTGPGAPWEGVQITRHLYAKPDFSGATTGEQRQRILENFNNDKSAKGKVLVEYDNHQGEDLDDLDEYGLPQEYDKNPPAIWRILMESEEHHHVWQPRPNQEPDSCGNGNRKRDGSCSKTAGSSGVSTASSSNSHGSSETASSSTTPSTAASLGSSTKSSSQTTSKPVITSTSGPGSTITPPPTSTSARTSGPSSTSLRCRHHADPDHGPGNEYCICEGHDGKYPMLSSTSGMSDYNICGYSTLPPTMTPASHPPFTATLSDGEVVQCASSTYYNYAVDHRPTCAGSTSVISTVASIASAYASSTSAAAASRSAASSSAAMASWSADAAKPSAGCSILDDDGWGDSLFMVYGINGWAGDDGSKLHDQEDGCGILSGWQWYVGDVEEFEGHERSAEHAVFGLSFFKGGCVEDAVKSAGGPDITCHHDNGEHSSPSMADAKSIAQKAQVSAVKALANGSLSARARRGDAGAISPQPTRTAKGRPTKTNAALVESAKAALPHLLEKIGASSDV